MSSKAVKSNKKDTSPKESAAQGEVRMVALTQLLEDHKAALSEEFKTTISGLESKIDSIQTAINNYGQRISSRLDARS